MNATLSAGFEARLRDFMEEEQEKKSKIEYWTLVFIPATNKSCPYPVKTVLHHCGDRDYNFTEDIMDKIKKHGLILVLANQRLNIDKSGNNQNIMGKWFCQDYVIKSYVKEGIYEALEQMMENPNI